MCIKRSENYFYIRLSFCIAAISSSVRQWCYIWFWWKHSQWWGRGWCFPLWHTDPGTQRCKFLQVRRNCHSFRIISCLHFFRIKENTDALNSPQFRLHTCSSVEGGICSSEIRGTTNFDCSNKHFPIPHLVGRRRKNCSADNRITVVLTQL